MFFVYRFLAAVSQAVIECGGQPNQFVGDGALALFGMNTSPRIACRQALKAAAMIATNVEELNQFLSHDLNEPIRFGIGIHGGSALVGEIGYGATRIYTALGDAPSLAAQLEALCGDLDVEVVISDVVGKQSGFELSSLGRRIVEARGFNEPIAVRIARNAEAIPVGV